MNPTAAEEALTTGNLNDKGENALAEEVMQRCIRIVANINRFKQPRLDRIQLYRDLYAGKVKKKFRQPFNVVLPVFAGIMDTLMSSFNDDLALEYHEQEPADYLAVSKLNALWGMESTSTAPNAKFPLKTRQDRSNALFSGRGFMMNYAVSDPEYHNCFEIFELEDAIFQPTGGGHLENHLYAGRQNIIRSASDLTKGSYDKTQVNKLISIAAKTDFDPTFADSDARAALMKFKAMGLSPESNDYIGEHLFKLVEMAVTVRGVRYHIVFSPWYQTWVRFDTLQTIFSADLYPWISWATHEDNRNFLSKSYSDDMYGVADATHTLFNQELTNREKRNYNARGYDREMFPDVAKLDAAQTRPDALVPIDTKGGTRRISEGIYTFETAELQGTINLVQWMLEQAGKDTGVTDLAMGGPSGASKRATVILAEQQAISKRLLLRSSSYTEAMGEVGKLFFQGCKDHLPAKRAIRLLGAQGEGWQAISRADLDLYSDVDVKVISSAIDMQNSQLKKKARLEVLTEISMNPNEMPFVNPQWLITEKLRSGGEYDDAEIKIATDTKNYGNKEEVARAHEAIQDVLNGKKPEQYYGATTLFMQIIHDFAVDNRNDLGDRKYQTLIDFEMAHAQIAQDNMARKAAQQANLSAPPGPGGAGAPAAPGTVPPTDGTTPNPMTTISNTAAAMP
jgi:hypothetical protein